MKNWHNSKSICRRVMDLVSNDVDFDGFPRFKLISQEHKKHRNNYGHHRRCRWVSSKAPLFK
jgi:hypothetical protein